MSDKSTVFVFPDREITLAVCQIKYHQLCSFLHRHPPIYNYKLFDMIPNVDAGDMGRFNYILNEVYIQLQDEYRFRHITCEVSEKDWSRFCSDWLQASTTTAQEKFLYMYLHQLYHEEPYDPEASY
jgi:hypothetical protein